MLNAERTALLQICRDRWAAVRVTTSPVYRSPDEAGVELAYRAACLAPVRHVEWCADPQELSRSRPADIN